MVSDRLLPEIVRGATLRGNEYGWAVSAFPDAIAKAQEHDYACLGGQFQFRLPDGGTCEMYWLEANSGERKPGEAWSNYSRRSCTEVLQGFQHLMSTTDFQKEASNWPNLQAAIEQALDSDGFLVFVACFVTEAEIAQTI
jgi:hypothetical protein